MTVVAFNEKESPMFAHIGDPKLRDRVIAAQQYALDKYTLHTTWKKTATALGISSESTLNAFVTASYNANPTNIVVAIERAKAREEERALSSFTPAFAETSVSRAIHRAVRQTRARGQLGILSGESGIGKTTALKQLCDADPSLIYVACNPTVSSGRRASLWPILALIFQRLGGDMRRVNCSPYRLYLEIGEVLKARPRMLVVDESQLIGSPHVFDTLRTLSDDFATPILFSGNDTLYEFAFLKSAQAAAFTQFTRRCSVTVHLTRSKITKADVTLIAAQRLGTEVIAETIDALSAISRGRGSLGELHNVLQRAHEMAKGGRITSAQVLEAIDEPIQSRKRGQL